MREGWETKMLKEFCNDYKQDIVDGPFGANLKREHYVDEGIPVLKIQNIKPFHIELKKMDYVSPEKTYELRRHGYTNGDIIITKLGLPLGAAAIVKDIPDGIIVADLVRVRAQKIDPQYLCYHLNSPTTNAFLNSQQGGATRPRVQISAVRELPITAPSLAEQKQIVAILDEAFEGIDRTIRNTEKNLANSRKLFESYLNAIFTQKGDGWVEKKLSEVCQVTGGGTPSKSNEEFYTGTIPWATVRDMKNEIIYQTECRITEEAVRKSSTNIIKKGNIVIATRVGLGKVCMVAQDTAINQDLRGIIPKNNSQVSPRFLFWWLKSIAHLIKKEGTGATVQGVKVTFINLLQIPTPTLSEQDRIVAILDELSRETQRLESIYRQKIAALKELKQSILQKAFTGELTAQPSSPTTADTSTTVKEEIRA